MRMLNYYKLLSLSEDDSCEDLYENCRKLFLENHPSTHKSKENYKMFILANEAYAVFLSEETREKYDFILSKYSFGDTFDINDRQAASEILNSIILKRKIANSIKSESNWSFFFSSFDFWNFF